MRGGPFQRFARRHVIGDVVERPDRAGVAVVGIHRQAAQPAREGAAVAAQEAQLAVEGLSGGKGRAHLWPQRCVRLGAGVDDLCRLAEQGRFIAAQQPAHLGADQLEAAVSAEADAHRRGHHHRLHALDDLVAEGLELRPLGGHVAQHGREVADLAGGGRPVGLRGQAAVKQVAGALLQQGQRPKLPPQPGQQAEAHRRQQQQRDAQRLGAAGRQRGQHIGARPPAPHLPAGAGHGGGTDQRIGRVQVQRGSLARPPGRPPPRQSGLQPGFGVDPGADARRVGVGQDLAGGVGDHHQLLVGMGDIGLGEGAGQVAAFEVQAATQQGHALAVFHHRVGQHDDGLRGDTAQDQVRHHRPSFAHGGAEVAAVRQVGAELEVALGIPPHMHPALGARDEHTVEAGPQDRLAIQKGPQRAGIAQRLHRQLRAGSRQLLLRFTHPDAQQPGTAQHLGVLLQIGRAQGVLFGTLQQQQGAQRDAGGQGQHGTGGQAELEGLQAAAQRGHRVGTLEAEHGLWPGRWVSAAEAAQQVPATARGQAAALRRQPPGCGAVRAWRGYRTVSSPVFGPAPPGLSGDCGCWGWAGRRLAAGLEARKAPRQPTSGPACQDPAVGTGQGGVPAIGAAGAHRLARPNGPRRTCSC